VIAGFMLKDEIESLYSMQLDQSRYDYSNICIYFNSIKKELKLLPPLMIPRADCSAIIFRNKLYVIGGKTKACEKLTGNTFEIDSYLNKEIANPLLVNIKNDTILAISQCDNKGLIHIYDSNKKDWIIKFFEFPTEIDRLAAIFNKEEIVYLIANLNASKIIIIMVYKFEANELNFIKYNDKNCELSINNSNIFYNFDSIWYYFAVRDSKIMLNSLDNELNEII
jgi:hypothetical protein